MLGAKHDSSKPNQSFHSCTEGVDGTCDPAQAVLVEFELPDLVVKSLAVRSDQEHVSS